MGFVRYASFRVLAAAVATAEGGLPADLMPGSLGGVAKTAHRHDFQYEPKPGMLYVRSRMISSRTNDNFDEFPAEEIKKAWRTFIGKPVFVNHNNADHRRARGVIIDAALHEDVAPDGQPDTWVEGLHEIDAVRFPKLAEAVVRGEVDRTSMGTDVAYSVCTFCGNRAETPMSYCAHIPRMKGQRVERRTASGAREMVLVAERCYGLGFFENSLLVEDPADPTAHAYGVDARGLAGTELAHLARVATKDRPLDGVGVAEDDDGTYVHTHRARSRSYPSVEEVPDSVVRLIESTGARVTELQAPAAAGLALQAADTGRVLMLQRSYLDLTDPARGKWEFPGGKVDEGEAPVVAAVREWGEEVGVQTPAGDITGSWRSPDGVYQGFVMVVPAEGDVPANTDSREVLNPDDPDGDDVEVVAWFAPQDVPEMPALRPEVKGTDWRLFKPAWRARTAVRTAGVMCSECNPEHGLPPQLCAPHAYQAKVRAQWGTSGLYDEDGAMAAVVARRALAYGEQKAPAEVDTLREEACPVCGDSESYQGERCLICGFVQPPEGFRDPDLDRAKQVDLRSSTLSCDSCGAEFDTKPAGDAPERPAAKTSGSLPPWMRDSEDKAKGSDPDDEDAAKPDLDESERAREGEGEDPESDGHRPGDPCPACGEGTLRARSERDEEPEGDEDRPEGEEPEAGRPEAPDEDEDDEDEDDEQDRRGPARPAPGRRQPPKGRQAHREASGVPMPENQRTPANPAQAQRNRLLAVLAAQQREIEAQRRRSALLARALTTLATAAGVERHPHFASLARVAADEEREPVARTDDQALEPDARESVEDLGSSPAPANEGVTPAATTDPATPDVALPGEVFNELEDPTAPVPGTDEVPQGAAAHVETEVRVGNPSSDTPFSETGWKASRRTAAVECPDCGGVGQVPGGTPEAEADGGLADCPTCGGNGEATAEQVRRFVSARRSGGAVRLLASIRLARLRRAAGTEDGDELAVGQAIHDSDLTDRDIEMEAATLAKVTSRQPQRQAQPRHLVPQRQAAAAVAPLSGGPAPAAPSSVEFNFL